MLNNVTTFIIEVAWFLLFYLHVVSWLRRIRRRGAGYNYFKWAYKQTNSNCHLCHFWLLPWSIWLPAVGNKIVLGRHVICHSIAIFWLKTARQHLFVTKTETLPTARLSIFFPSNNMTSLEHRVTSIQRVSNIPSLSPPCSVESDSKMQHLPLFHITRLLFQLLTPITDPSLGDQVWED